ncbi:MAG TPA: hypothetical protein VJ788_05465 [Gemmatimonadota bacterium]|nr:hypothetical protein [Gemmatimonadota bacterium]
MRNHRSLAVLALAVAAAFACENDPGVGVEGTFPVTITYHVDTCVGDDGRSEAIELVIERDGDDVTITVTGAGVLTGTFNPEDRVMTVDGTISVPNPLGGTFPGEMLMFARVTNETVNVSGGITFEGTFPGVSGTCERQFLGSGQRGNLMPFPLTGS